MAIDEGNQGGDGGADANGADAGGADTSGNAGEPDPDPDLDPGRAEMLRLEEFIFVRELYEVFLLLDHISGRWDKDLRAIAGTDPANIIRTICAIGLAPARDPALRLDQAVALMSTKDVLNAVARPATGLTVAFTILVVGEENRRKRTNALRRLVRGFLAGDGAPRESPASPSHSAAHSPPHLPPGSTPPLPPPLPPTLKPVSRRGSGGVLWDKPTRVTLARYAYPGLISVAIKFNQRMLLLVLFLLVALAFTCALSWHISAGNVILQHLEEVRARTASWRAEVSAAELKYAADERVRRAGAGANVAAAGTSAEAVEAIRFCTLNDGPDKPRYRNTEEYQLCERGEALREERRAVRLNLRQWLAPWKTIYGLFPAPAEPVEPRPKALDAAQRKAQDERDRAGRRGTEEKARIVTLVVGTALLPLAYGVLGAGAAVVRRLWERMRESLLSPRDSTLALLQLALGGTIGACIGLFINPSGPAPAEEHGLLGSWALSGSALSFIAGFGVEGVFRALEAFVHRVFSVSDHPKPPG